MAYTERYVDAAAAGGGDGTTAATSGANGAYTLAEAITHSAANTGIRYNIKAGTYANTTTSRTFNGVGLTTAPNWWRGYNAAIGDLDNDFTTAKPLISFTTGRFIVTGAHQIFSNLSINGAATTAGQVAITGASCRFIRCRMECTGANALSRAVTLGTGSGQALSNCWLKATSTATSVVNVASSGMFSSCVFEGGGHGLDFTAGTLLTVYHCVFRSNGADGINASSTGATGVFIFGCTFYNPASDGVEFAFAPTGAIVADCIFSNCSAYGINNSTGANTNLIRRANNASYSLGSAQEIGFGDSPSTWVAESASPFTNAGGGDFSLVTGALSKAAGAPGLFENQSYSGYLDLGAVQRQETGGGSAGFIGIIGG